MRYWYVKRYRRFYSQELIVSPRPRRAKIVKTLLPYFRGSMYSSIGFLLSTVSTSMLEFKSNDDCRLRPTKIVKSYTHRQTEIKHELRKYDNAFNFSPIHLWCVSSLFCSSLCIKMLATSAGHVRSLARHPKFCRVVCSAAATHKASTVD